MIQNPALLLVVMTAAIAFSYILEGRLQWARRIGPVLMIITLGIILSNLKIVTQTSPVYDVTFKYLIPLSISLLVLRLSFKELKQVDGKLILYFFLGSFGTIVGAVTTFFLFRDLVGDEAWKLSGQLTASYIGGGENAVAVGTALKVSKDLFTAAFASDNIVTAIWMLVCLSAPVGLNTFFTSKLPEKEINQAKEQSTPFTSHELLPSFFYSLTIAGVIVAASEWIARYVPYIPAIIWVTTFSILLAQTKLREKCKVSYLLGSMIFNYFFFTLGAISSIAEVIQLGPPVFVFVATVVLVHAIIVFGVGKLVKADLPKLIVASQANIGGPSTACALAEANDWPHLVLPGILLGVLGYAIANYIGLGMAYLLLSFQTY